MATVPTTTTQGTAAVVASATINSQGNVANYLAGRVESGGARRPLAVLNQTVAQSIASSGSVFVAINFDAEDVDYDNGHSLVSNTSRYTAATAGWYHVEGSAGVAASATGIRTVAIRINGTTIKAQAAGVASAAQSSDAAVSRLVFLNVGDYVELVILQSSGGALNTTVTNGNPTMSIEWRSV